MASPSSTLLMSKPSSTTSSSMSSTSSVMSMSSVMMVFSASPSTPLYSSSWAPASTGQYAGTCIFLIILAFIFRFLLSCKALLERKWLVSEMRRQYIFDSGRLQVKTDRTGNWNTKGTTDAAIVDQGVLVARNERSAVPPWRISTDVPRAVVDTIIVGVGYLLMLAVMTMNVGYFMSVLGGTFLGSVLLGRHSHAAPSLH